MEDGMTRSLQAAEQGFYEQSVSRVTVSPHV